MRDFFLLISRKPDKERVVSSAVKYYNTHFSESYNKSFNDRNIGIAYSLDHEDKQPVISLENKFNKPLILISGNLEIPGNYRKKISQISNSINSEIIVNLYEKFGIRFFQECTGHFNVIIFHFDKNELIAINSKLGLYPLYYYYNSDSIMISTRLGLFKHILSSIIPNEAVIMQFSLYNYPFSDNTFYKGIKLQPSASILKFNNFKLQISKYWTIEDVNKEKRPLYNFNDSVDLIDNVLHKLIKKKCEEHQSIGISLTAGWDGRLLLAYALKYKESNKIMLYSHGSRTTPDIQLPLKTSRKLGYNYVPIYLDDPNYLKDQLQWADKTVSCSDGLRPIKRCHYLYNMDILRKQYGLRQILSGNGGSNLIKISNYSACGVFNKSILELVESDNLEKVLVSHFNFIKQKYPNLSSNLDLNLFLDSFNIKEINYLNSIDSPIERFRYLLISEIERKYFGSEMQSYRHLINNYSPFFADEFISSLTQSVFWRLETKKGLRKSHLISLLYSKLISRNNKVLAKEPTDRGFSMYDLSHPHTFLSMLGKYSLTHIKRVKSANHFQTNNLSDRFIKRYLPELSDDLSDYDLESSFVSNYISAKHYLIRD